MKIVMLAHDLKVTVWQWPEHRVLWVKNLPKESQAQVLCEGPDGAMICHLGANHYFVLWPENVLPASDS